MDPSDDTEVFAGIVAGSYDVTEAAPPGWSLESIICTGDTDNGSVVDLANNKVTIDFDGGEDIACTFSNAKNGSITIEKQTLPDGDPATFDFTGDAAGTIGDGDTITVSDLAPGTYTSTETVPAGWGLTSIVCDDTDSSGTTATATFVVAAGETVTCTFTNTKNSSITIVKDADPADDTAFGFTSPIAFTLMDPSFDTATFNAVPGSYDVTETVPAGWTLDDIVCTGDGGTLSVVDVPNGLVTINLDPGEDITCTFTNVKHLVWSKSFDGPTVPGGAPTLTFTITNQSPFLPVTDISFTDDLDAVITDLVAVAPPTIPCGGESSLSGTSLLTFTDDTLGPGEICTFSVDLLVPPTATPGSFLNTTSDLFGGAGLGSPSAPVVPLIATGVPFAGPATATLIVEPPPAFAKQFAPDDIQFGEVSTLTFTIDNSASSLAASSLDFTDMLPPGLEIASPSGAATTCTGGTLTAVPATDLIIYTGTGSVSAGVSCTVTVDVLGVSAGDHDNTSGDLTSSSGNSGPAMDTLAIGEPGRIVIIKDTVPDGPQDFTFDFDSAGLFDLDDDPGDLTLPNTMSFTDLAAGLYTVTEETVPGYITSVICDDPDGQTTAGADDAAIDVDAGETVTCTFTNTALGSITIVKAATPADDTAFDFSEMITPGTFTLMDPSDETRTFTGLAAGSYDVTETVPANWTLESIVCTGDTDAGSVVDLASNKVTIDLDPDEGIICTFSNQGRGTIVIIKDTQPDGPQDFGFTTTGGLVPATFELDDDADATLPNTQTYADIPAGTYSATELGSTGFFASLSCTDPDNSTSTAARTATIDLDPGETVTCTFTNIEPLDLEKATSGQDADTPPGPVLGIGVDVNWTYVVTNVADTTITEIVLSDDQLGVIACPATVLGPFASMTCTASAPVVLGQYANVATVTGLTPLDDVVGDSDPSHYVGSTAAIDIEKATNGVDADTLSPQNRIPVGTAVTWTYVVTNTGTLMLTDVAVTDDVRGPICAIGTLAPGASATCSASSVAVEGLYVNVGHARGDSAIGHRADSDPSHYRGIETAGGSGTSITATPTATATATTTATATDVPTATSTPVATQPAAPTQTATPDSGRVAPLPPDTGSGFSLTDPRFLLLFAVALLVLSGSLGAIGLRRRSAAASPH